MKTLALIACLLGVVYCANRQAVESWHNDVSKCTQETSKPPPNPDTLLCIAIKQNLLDGQNKYVIEKSSEHLDQIITDEAKRNEAKEIVRKCYSSLEYTDKPEMNAEQTKKGATCSMPVYDMIDKL